MISSPALDAAGAIMPGWVTGVSLVLIPVLTFIVCAVLCYLSVRVATFREPALSAPWPEGARASYPARQAKQLTLWMGFGFMIAFLNDNQNPLLQISLAKIAAICFVVVLAASAMIDHALVARLGGPTLGWRERVTAIATAWLVNPSVLILGVLLFAMPGELSWRAAALSAIGFGAFAASYWFGPLALLVRIGLAKPASPRLDAAVRKASEQTGTHPAAVYEIGLPMANAFALLLPNQVVFTRRAVDVLDDEELVAIARHELAHLAEPLKIKLLHFSANLIVFSIAWSGIAYLHFGWNGVLGLVAAAFGVSGVFRRWMRRLESRADAAGRKGESQDGVYAVALERIYRASNIPATIRGGSHGSLYDRMTAAGVVPQYPRPQPPSRVRLLTALGACAVLFLGMSTGFDWLSESLSAKHLRSENQIMWSLALGLGGAPEVARLAEISQRAGRPEQAAILYAAAGELDGDSVVYPAKLAATLSALGRCDEAFDAWSEARDNLKYCACRSENGSASATAAREAELAVNRCSPHRSL